MSQYLTDGYYGETAAYAPTNERVSFIQRTYLHLCGAVLAFVGLEALLINSGIGEQFLKMLIVNRMAWIGLMVFFIAGGMFAQWLARSDSPPATQYFGLALYVGIEAIFFLPILTLCMHLGPSLRPFPFRRASSR
jgi:FtsH-binding integral membrane protein